MIIVAVLVAVVDVCGFHDVAAPKQPGLASSKQACASSGLCCVKCFIFSLVGAVLPSGLIFAFFLLVGRSESDKKT